MAAKHCDCEEWRPITGFPGYEVSNLGRVRSSRADKGHRVLVMRTNTNRGYEHVTLSSEGGRKTSEAVHRLVLMAFTGAPPDGTQARHLNGNRRDNRSANLVWGTALENARDRDAHGRTARGMRQGAHTKPESRLRGERHGRALPGTGNDPCPVAPKPSPNDQAKCAEATPRERAFDYWRDRCEAAEAKLAEMECTLLTSKQPPPAQIWMHHDGIDWCVHLVRRAGLVQYASVTGVPEPKT